MRLIDADKLSSEMEFVFENARGMTALAARLVWAFVERADTVEKKGYWINTNPEEENDPRTTCSVCGNIEVLHKANFCPNCGADMRES